jgi:hypothetical protein
VSETKHSPEPADDGAFSDMTCYACGGKPVNTLVGYCDTHVPADGEARRIAAALAAVEGIPTEALEAGALAKALDLAQRYVALLHSDYCGRTCRCGEERAALRSVGRLK